MPTPTNWTPFGDSADFGVKDEGDFAFVIARSEAARDFIADPDNTTGVNALRIVIDNSPAAIDNAAKLVHPLTIGEV